MRPNGACGRNVPVKRGGFKAWMMEYAYLVTLGAVIAVVIGSALFAHQVRRESEQGVQAAADAPEIAETHTPSITPMPTIAPPVVRPALLAAQSAVWPVEGELLRRFDAQTLVWWASLSLWRAHMGLDIAGEAGQSVRCCTDGRVKSSTWDELWGWRVVVEQTDGRQTTYCGLESSVVSAGERVTRGQTLGTLLERIPCEAEEAAHLHLEVQSKGQMQDPEAMLPER